jgi:hypothetical protein
MLSPRFASFDPKSDTRAGLLQRARAARTAQDVAHTRQALRTWMQTHPTDIEVLLADEQMLDRSRPGWLWR